MAQTVQVLERLHSRDSKVSGPWDSEPDRIAWTDLDTGYPSLMRRNPAGSWCGYVAVPPGHTAHGQDYNDIEGIEVHGGLTYAQGCLGAPAEGVCHVPAEGEPDDVWWLGFDCAHSEDDNWMMAELRGEHPELVTWSHSVYRDVGYVRQEVSRLAQQLREMQ